MNNIETASTTGQGPVTTEIEEVISEKRIEIERTEIYRITDELLRLMYIEGYVPKRSPFLAEERNAVTMYQHSFKPDRCAIDIRRGRRIVITTKPISLSTRDIEIQNYVLTPDDKNGMISVTDALRISLNMDGTFTYSIIADPTFLDEHEAQKPSNDKPTVLDLKDADSRALIDQYFNHEENGIILAETLNDALLKGVPEGGDSRLKGFNRRGDGSFLNPLTSSIRGAFVAIRESALNDQDKFRTLKLLFDFHGSRIKDFEMFISGKGLRAGRADAVLGFIGKNALSGFISGASLYTSAMGISLFGFDPFLMFYKDRAQDPVDSYVTYPYRVLTAGLGALLGITSYSYGVAREIERTHEQISEISHLFGRGYNEER